MLRAKKLNRFAVPVVGAALCLALAACAPEMPEPTPTPTETLTPSGDGVLRIGTLFPVTGDSAALGAAQVAAVELAVREINEAGGVNGQPVEVFHRDSGDPGGEKAAQSLAELIAKQVDVVIGSSSSVLDESLVPAALEAGAVIVAPADTGVVPASVDDDFVARLKFQDPALKAFDYTAEVYDAVIVVALAATMSGDDAGASIAWSIDVASYEGIECTSFGACLDVLETEPDIDYEGLGGALDFIAEGHPGLAYYGVDLRPTPTPSETPEA